VKIEGLMAEFDKDAPFAAADVIRAARPGFSPELMIILGSGLAPLAAEIDNATIVDYDRLPGFPNLSVAGHVGRLYLGHLCGLPVACLQGRKHYYEGEGLSVMTPAIRALKLAGAKTLLVTNATGSLRPEVLPGSLVSITDHINLMPGTPMVGPNDARFGERFFSMANAYDATLRARIHALALGLGIKLVDGVYIAVPGPNFETAAEIRMMARLGADIVGMSSVPEVIAARHCGLTVAALSVITNLAEGLTADTLSHEHTLKYAEIGAVDLIRLVKAFCQDLAAHS
jgi:xanthosine phosphorylase